MRESTIPVTRSYLAMKCSVEKVVDREEEDDRHQQEAPPWHHHQKNDMEPCPDQPEHEEKHGGRDQAAGALAHWHGRFLVITCCAPLMPGSIGKQFTVSILLHGTIDLNSATVTPAGSTRIRFMLGRGSCALVATEHRTPQCRSIGASTPSPN